MRNKKTNSLEESEQTSVQPLVSVVVITYNSSGTVLETLDSIKNQTYTNIELLVSDDCSKDDTVQVIQRWLDDNCRRFADANLITTEFNTGTSANLNRGCRSSHGEWIKIIAGDDRLKPKCIERFVEFVTENKCEFCCCDIEPFGAGPDRAVFYERAYDIYFSCVKENMEEKKARIIHELRIPAPGWLFSRRLYDEIGGFDEKYKLLEEWPFVYKALKEGYDIYPVDGKLIEYRVSDDSVSHFKDNGRINHQWFIDKKLFFDNVLSKELIRNGFIGEAWSKRLRYYVYNKNYKESSLLKKKLIRMILLADVCTIYYRIINNLIDLFGLPIQKKRAYNY